MTKWRRCEVLVKNNFIERDLSLVKAGDKFRLFEDDGTPVEDKNGQTIFIALQDAIPCEPEGNYSVTT